MDKLVSQMFLNADLTTIKNAINCFIRDGVLTTTEDYFKLCGIVDEPASDQPEVFSPSLREQPSLGNDSRAVWCVGLSAIVAERGVTLPEGAQTTVKLLAVKGMVHLDRTAYDDWVTLQLGFQAMGLATREMTTWSLPLEWQLATIEREMVEGKKPHIPDKTEFTQRLLADPLGDGEESGGWLFFRPLTANEPTDWNYEVKCIERIWQRYLRDSSAVSDEIRRMYADRPELLEQEWEAFSEMTDRWPQQFLEIQRLKDRTVEEATALYFAESGAGESVQSQMPTAHKRQGGRPRLSENEWAYEQVWVKGRERQEVFREWLERIGSRKALLADPRDSFNKAIKEKSRTKRK